MHNLRSVILHKNPIEKVKILEVCKFGITNLEVCNFFNYYSPARKNNFRGPPECDAYGFLFFAYTPEATSKFIPMQRVNASVTLDRSLRATYHMLAEGVCTALYMNATSRLRADNHMLAEGVCFVVFGRCRNKEPHSSGILLCRVVVVGYEN